MGYPTSLRIVNWIKYHNETCKLKKSREIVNLINKNWSSINHWLETMLHLDNNYPSFNDGSISSSPKYESLYNYITKLGLTKKKVNKEPIIKNIYFKDSGF